MVGIAARTAATLATVAALVMPAVTTVHAANGQVDSATFAGGVCVFAGAFPDATGPCLANISFPFTATNASVSTFSGGGTIIEPAGDTVTLSYTGNAAQVTPNCMGCPGVGTAVLVGQATDEGVSCPLTGTIDVVIVGSVAAAIGGNLTWEGC